MGGKVSRKRVQAERPGKNNPLSPYQPASDKEGDGVQDALWGERNPTTRIQKKKQME